MADEAETKTAEKPTKTRASREESHCSIQGCKRPYRAKGYCNVHYSQWRRHEMEGHKARYKICSKEACRKPATTHGLCEEHAKAKAEGAAA